jgi:hypothetical protein
MIFIKIRQFFVYRISSDSSSWGVNFDRPPAWGVNGGWGAIRGNTVFQIKYVLNLKIF